MKWLIVVLCLFTSCAFADLNKEKHLAVVTIHDIGPRTGVIEGAGSGFFVSPHYIVSAAHLLFDRTLKYKNTLPEKMWYSSTKGQYHELTIVAYDKKNDILILHSKQKWPYYLQLDPKIQVNDPIIAYGNFEEANLRTDAGKVTNFEMSKCCGYQFAAADIYAYDGFSGGPVVNRITNKVCGVVNKTQKYIFSKQTEFVRIEYVDALFKKHGIKIAR